MQYLFGTLVGGERGSRWMHLIATVVTDLQFIYSEAHVKLSCFLCTAKISLVESVMCA